MCRRVAGRRDAPVVHRLHSADINAVLFCGALYTDQPATGLLALDAPHQPDEVQQRSGKWCAVVILFGHPTKWPDPGCSTADQTDFSFAWQVMQLYLSGDETYSCATDGTSSFSKCNALNFTDPLLSPGDATISQQEVLDHFDVEKGPWVCAAFLAAMSIFCRLLAYRLLRAQTNGFEGCDCAISMPCVSKDDGEGEKDDDCHDDLVP